jgi:hypothetical protein
MHRLSAHLAGTRPQPQRPLMAAAGIKVLIPGIGG